MAEKRYIEVIEAAQYADVFFADPLLKIATASLLATAPTANVVEVTRCKDCAQWGGVAFGNVCRRWSAPLAGMKNCTSPDDYCSYGECKIENP